MLLWAPASGWKEEGGPEPQSFLRLLSSSTAFTGLWYDCQRKQAHLEKNPYKYVPSTDSVILEMRIWEIHGEFVWWSPNETTQNRYVYLITCVEIHTANVHALQWSSYSDPVPLYIYSWSPCLPRIKKVEQAVRTNSDHIWAIWPNYLTTRM